MKKQSLLLIAAACFCFLGCKPEKKAAAPAAPAAPASANPLSAPADYLGAMGKAQQSAQKTLSTVGLDQALKTFYTDEGRFPKDLNELVSKGTISQIPPPPRGMKYQYDAKAGTIKVVPE